MENREIEDPRETFISPLQINGEPSQEDWDKMQILKDYMEDDLEEYNKNEANDYTNETEY